MNTFSFHIYIIFPAFLFLFAGCMLFILIRLSKKRNLELEKISYIQKTSQIAIDDIAKRLKSSDQALSVLINRSDKKVDLRKVANKTLLNAFKFITDDNLKEYLTIKTNTILARIEDLRSQDLRSLNVNLLRTEFNAERRSLKEVAKIIDVKFNKLTTPSRKRELDIFLSELEHIITYKGSNDIYAKFDNICYHFVVEQINETVKDYNSYLVTGKVESRFDKKHYINKITKAHPLEDVISEMLSDYNFDDYKDELYLLSAAVIDETAQNAVSNSTSYSSFSKVRKRLLQIIDFISNDIGQ